MPERRRRGRGSTAARAPGPSRPAWIASRSWRSSCSCSGSSGVAVDGNWHADRMTQLALYPGPAWAYGAGHGDHHDRRSGRRGHDRGDLARGGRSPGRALRRALGPGWPCAQPRRAVPREPRAARALQGRRDVRAGWPSARCCRRSPASRSPACACAGAASCTARRRSALIPAILKLRGRRAPVGRELPRLGGAPHRRAHGRAALERRRRVRLPSRPRVAVGRVRLGAHGPHAADAAARRALPARRLAGAGGHARRARRGARRASAATASAWTELSGITIVATEPADAARLLGEPLRRRQRPHALRRPRRAPAPRRPVRRLRPRRVRLGRALHRARSVAGARRARS